MKTALLESVVLNPDDVTSFANSWSAKVRFPEGKAWVAKRIRQVVMNSDGRLLKPLAGHQIPPSAPSYVTNAIDRGETVYRFDGTVTNELAELGNQTEIISDFLNGLFQQANEAVDEANMVAREDQALAKKTLSKLDKMNWTQALQAAQTWADRASKRSSKLNKDGGEVIMQWPDGYYAIRFTDKNTMMRDGGQLQNCLAQGMYWEQVALGNQLVIAIRKPNDEAVVGLRFDKSGATIHECKGKNNRPITALYVPYVVDLLARFNTSNSIKDLTDAGIEFNKITKRYGTFKEIATKVHDRNSIKIYETTTNGVVEYKNRDVVSYSIQNGKIASFDLNEGSTTIDEFINFMNLIGRDATDNVQNRLAERGIYIRNGKYGDIRMVGTSLGTFSTGIGLRTMDVYQVGSESSGSIVMIFSTGEQSMLSVSGHKVVSGDRTSMTMIGRPISEVLNAAGIRGDSSFENTFIHPKGWAFSEKQKQYVDLTTDRPAKTFETNAGSFDLYGTPGRRTWLVQTSSQDPEFLTIRIMINGRADFTPEGVTNSTPVLAQAIRWLLEKGYGKSVDSPASFGISYDVQKAGKRPRQLWNPLDVAEALKEMPETKRAYWPLATFTGPESRNNEERETTQYMAALVKHNLFTPEVQKAFIDALRPKDSFRILKSQDYSFSGIELTKYEIVLPSMLMHFLNEGMFTDPEAETAAKKIRSKIESDVSAFMENNKEIAYFSAGGNWPWDDFRNFLYKLNYLTVSKIEEASKRALDNPKTSIEDKFAALNTANKLGRNRR